MRLVVALREVMPTVLTHETLDSLDAFECIVLRGLPGSGKSTLALRLCAERGYGERRVHLEADQHFVVAGTYRFDPLRAADAHAVVARDALALLQAGRRVAVANTHVRLWEMAAIVGAARLSGASICFLECNGAWRSVHGVPADVIAKMRERWEPLPAEFEPVSFCIEPGARTTA